MFTVAVKSVPRVSQCAIEVGVWQYDAEVSSSDVYL